MSIVIMMKCSMKLLVMILQRDDSIVIVEVTGENFENFIDPETETEAYKIFENFSFKEIGYVDYGDWDCFFIH